MGWACAAIPERTANHSNEHSHFLTRTDLFRYECKWSDEQRSFFIALLASHGRNWSAIAQLLNVSEEEVNAYYNLNREDLKLDEFLPEGVRRTRMRPAGLAGSGGPTPSTPASISPSPTPNKKKTPKTSLSIKTSLPTMAGFGPPPERIDVEGGGFESAPQSPADPPLLKRKREDGEDDEVEVKRFKSDPPLYDIQSNPASLSLTFFQRPSLKCLLSCRVAERPAPR